MTTTDAPVERVYKILLVDDEELLCRAVVRLLKSERRFTFRPVVSARQAPRIFADEGPFDVLLTDLSFPDGRGVALAEALQRMQPSLRVVFMSGDIPDDFAAGHRLALYKPFEREDLIQVLERALDLD